MERLIAAVNKVQLSVDQMASISREANQKAAAEAVQTEQKAVDSAKKAYESASAEVEKTEEKIVESAEKTAESVASEAEKAEEKITESVSDSSEDIETQADDTGEAYEEAWQDIQRGSADAADNVVSDARQAGDKIERTAEDTGASVSDGFGKISSVFKKLAVAAAAAFSFRQVVEFGKQAVETASDLSEVQNVVDTAFGTMSDKMEEFAATSVKQFGISRLEAKRTGSTFMAMASGMGIAQETASDMAVALTGLSADMASFYNVEQDVASTALKSVFTGETETLKQFGIVMTDANLQAFALSQGITKSTAQMSQAEKVQLRYNYVMAQTTLAQGDFAKTSDSWANQTRILSEQWKEFGTVVGDVLMTVLLPAVKALNSMLSQLISTARAAAQALANAFGFELGANADAAAGIVDSTAEAADNYDDIADSAEAVEEAQENQLAAFDEINKLSSDSADNTSDDTSAAPSTSPALTPEVDAKKANSMLDEFVKSARKAFSSLKKYIDEKFKPTFDGIWDGLKAETFKLQQTLGGVFSDIKTLAEPLKSYFAGDFTTFLQTAFATLGNIAVGLFDSFNMVFSDIWNVAAFPMLQNFVTVGLPLITQFATQMLLTISTLFDSIKELFDTFWQEFTVPILDEIAQIWNDVWQTLSDAWAEWGQPIFDSLREAITGTKDTILNIWEQWLRPLFDEFMAIIDSVWTEHLQPLLAEFLDFVGQLVSGALEIYNSVILPVINWLVQKLQPVVKREGSYVLGVFHEILNAVIERARGIIRVLSGIVQFVTGAFTGDWQKAWNGIKQIFKGVWDSFYAVVKLPINLIIGAINAMTGAISDALNYIVDAVNELSFEVPDWVPGIGGEEFGFDLPNVYIPEIPKLAAGTVVPANYGEFMAVLGDNTREPEVVSPLSTMKQAVLEALVAYGGDGSGQKQPLYVTVQLDRRRVGQAMIDDINERTRRNGRSPLKA